MNKKLLALPMAALFATVLACLPASAADAYPNKVITLVVPAVPGGALDVIARTMADEMSKKLGQPIIIDNRPGAGGIVAVQTVARATPDGYTVLLSNSGPFTTLPYLYSKVPYDVKRDLAFVSQLCVGQLVLAVNADKVPARNMKEFVAWAAANKGKVNYGSYGIGSGSHLMGAYLSQSRNLDMMHVAYKGEPPMLQDLMGGEVSWAIGTLGSVAPFIDKGRIRALAVMGDKRTSELPDVPTIAEAGFPDPELKTNGWIGMVVPAQTPAPVAARLEAEARAASRTTAMKARLQAFGMEPTGTTGAEFRREYEANAKLNEQLVKMSGAKAE